MLWVTLIIVIIWLLSKLRLLWQFGTLEIKLQTKLPLLIVTDGVFLDCVRFYNISNNKALFYSCLNICKTPWKSIVGAQQEPHFKNLECCTLGNINKMAAPMGQHGKYLFWPQLLNNLSDFLAVFADGLINKSSLCPDQGDWCHSSPWQVPRGHKLKEDLPPICVHFLPCYDDILPTMNGYWCHSGG